MESNNAVPTKAPNSPLPTEKIEQAFKNVDNKELKSSSFWLSQLFMVLSTVLAVYLAAHTGLKQALKFDTFNKMENNYYLRVSLFDEVYDNATNVTKFAERLAKRPPTSEIKTFKPTIEKYIWQTMQFSSTTLETPSQLLTQIRRFYSRTEFIMNAASHRTISATQAAIELNKISDLIQTKTLPALKNSAEKLKLELQKNDIFIGSLKELNYVN